MGVYEKFVSDGLYTSLNGDDMDDLLNELQDRQIAYTLHWVPAEGYTVAPDSEINAMTSKVQLKHMH